MIKSVCYPIIHERVFHRNTVFIVMSPAHGNLGDHAIAYSEEKLLDELGIRYFEVSGQNLLFLESCRLLKIFNGCKIITNGGGYLGTLWPRDEKALRSLIDSTPKSKILFFPNTVFYDNTEFGNNLYKDAKDYYTRPNVFKMYAREKSSYEKMQDFCKNVGICPDIVMRLQEDDYKGERSGCVLSLRRDIEKTISPIDEELLINTVCEMFGEKVSYLDTVKDYSIDSSKRLAELQKFFYQYKKSELVVTDRLHGMIIAAITGTPCIVINSKSPKVLGCYEWIRHLDYIKVCTEIRDLPTIFVSIPTERHVYENESIKKAFSSLIDDVKRFALESN